MERLDMEVMKKFDLLLFLPHGADPKLTCKRKGDTWKIIQSGTQESGVASLREDGMLIWDSPPNTLGAQGLRLSMLRFVSGASVKEFVLHDVVEFKPTTVPSNDFGLSFEKCPAVPKTIIIRDLRIRHGTVECALPQLELQLIPNGKVVIHNKSDDLANALNIESVYFATKVEGTSKGKPLKVKFDLLRDDGSLKKDDEQRFEEIKGRIGQLDMALANSIKQMDVSKLGTAIQRMKEFEEKMNQPNPSMPTSRPNDAMEIQELKRKVAASRSEIQTLQERRDAREKQQADLRRALSKLSIVRGRVWYSVSYADETVEVELFSISASR